MAVPFEQNECRNLLVPLIMHAGATIIDGRLSMSRNTRDRYWRDICRRLVPEPI